jgi:plastocyanin
VSRGVPAVLAAALLAGGLACRPAARTAAPVATDHVLLPRSYLFQPAAIRVRAGTRVWWRNADAFTHAVRLAGSARPLVMAPGDSVSVVVGRPGVLRYDCPFHPQMMKGTIEVTPR